MSYIFPPFSSDEFQSTLTLQDDISTSFLFIATCYRIECRGDSSDENQPQKKKLRKTGILNQGAGAGAWVMVHSTVDMPTPLRRVELVLVELYV